MSSIFSWLQVKKKKNADSKYPNNFVIDVGDAIVCSIERGWGQLKFRCKTFTNGRFDHGPAITVPWNVIWIESPIDLYLPRFIVNSLLSSPTVSFTRFFFIQDKQEIMLYTSLDLHENY